MDSQKKTLVLKRNDDDLLALVKLVSEGYILLCPVCNEEVWVIDTKEKMNRYQSARGARCSKTPEHYGFYLIEPRKSDFLRNL